MKVFDELCFDGHMHICIPTIPATRSGLFCATTKLIHAPTPCPTSTVFSELPARAASMRAIVSDAHLPTVPSSNFPEDLPSPK